MNYNEFLLMITNIFGIINLVFWTIVAIIIIWAVIKLIKDEKKIKGKATRRSNKKVVTK